MECEQQKQSIQNKLDQSNTVPWWMSKKFQELDKRNSAQSKNSQQSDGFMCKNVTLKDDLPNYNLMQNRSLSLKEQRFVKQVQVGGRRKSSGSIDLQLNQANIDLKILKEQKQIKDFYCLSNEIQEESLNSCDMEREGSLASQVDQQHDTSIGSPLQSSQSNFRITYGHCSLAKPAKQKQQQQLCEDAFFISEDNLAFGVADGVSACILEGVNSGLYSQQIMEEAQSTYQSKKKQVDPMQLLLQAHKNSNFPGACTACIAILKQNLIEVANLGDSGLLVIRNREIAFQTETQQYYFNCPYQMNRDEPPNEAKVSSFEMQSNDIIVIATDGLYDNIFPQNIAQIVSDIRFQDYHNATQAAQIIATYAHQISQDKQQTTPFQKKAQEVFSQNPEIWYNMKGGKLDDVTVLVLYISGEDDISEEELGQHRGGQSTASNVYSVKSSQSDVTQLNNYSYLNSQYFDRNIEPIDYPTYSHTCYNQRKSLKDIQEEQQDISWLLALQNKTQSNQVNGVCNENVQDVVEQPVTTQHVGLEQDTYKNLNIESILDLNTFSDI